MRNIIMIISTCILAVSCSTLNTVIKEKEEGKGSTVVYDVNFEEAWLISRKSFRWAGTDAIEEHKSEGYMLTSKGRNFVSDGSVMGAWVEPISENKMAVTVISKRRVSIDLFTGMTEMRFHELFNKGVEIIKSGEELPLSAPRT